MMRYLLIFLCPLLTLIIIGFDADDSREDKLTLRSPEEAGISSRAIMEFIHALEKEHPDAIHSVMIRRYGKIVVQGLVGTIWCKYTSHVVFA